MELVKLAKDLEMGFIALDDRERFKGLPFSDSLISRDHVWASKLKFHFLNYPKSKVVLLSGAIHSFEKFHKESIGIKTVIEQVEESVGVQGQSVLVQDKKTSSFYGPIFRNFFNEENILYLGKELRPYTSGFIIYHNES